MEVPGYIRSGAPPWTQKQSMPMTSVEEKIKRAFLRKEHFFWTQQVMLHFNAM